MRDISYWPTTFLNEIESYRPEAAPRLWSLGGPSFLYRSANCTVWIDPYFGGTPDDAVPDAYRATAISIKPEEIRQADIIISTHDHVDHCHDKSILPILQNTQAMCVAPTSSAKKMKEWGVPDDRLQIVKPGDVVSRDGLEIATFAGYDANEPHAVTFVFEANGCTLFVSGDTAKGPALKQVGERFKLDYALLAFGRTWYMNEEEMLDAASVLSPRILLPFHWEFWRNHTGDIAKLVRLHTLGEAASSLQVLQIGDWIDLESAP